LNSSQKWNDRPLLPHTLVVCRGIGVWVSPRHRRSWQGRTTQAQPGLHQGGGHSQGRRGPVRHGIHFCDRPPVCRGIGVWVSPRHRRSWQGRTTQTQSGLHQGRGHSQGRRGPERHDIHFCDRPPVCRGSGVWVSPRRQRSWQGRTTQTQSGLRQGGGHSQGRRGPERHGIHFCGGPLGTPSSPPFSFCPPAPATAQPQHRAPSPRVQSPYRTRAERSRATRRQPLQAWAQAYSLATTSTNRSPRVLASSCI
jgi:hypothetical protein